jgi:hypothetical protein
MNQVDYVETLSKFSNVLDKLKENGGYIQRCVWNNKYLKVKLQMPHANSEMTLPYLYIECQNRDRRPWFPSTTDELSSDWRHVTEEYSHIQSAEYSQKFK